MTTGTNDQNGGQLGASVAEILVVLAILVAVAAVVLVSVRSLGG